MASKLPYPNKLARKIYTIRKNNFHCSLCGLVGMTVSGRNHRLKGKFATSGEFCSFPLLILKGGMLWESKISFEKEQWRSFFPLRNPSP